MIIDKKLSRNFTLVVKHNALFAALLPRLVLSFSCLGLVRNPLSILASWQTVNLPVHRGRIPEGEALDRHLHSALEQESELLRRQIVVLNWFMARFRNYLAPENVIRYEDLVASGGRILFRKLGHPSAGSVSLYNMNYNSVYNNAEIDILLGALLTSGGEWTHFYSHTDCERIADKLRNGPQMRGADPSASLKE